jgi:hypothetical protein
MGPRIGPIFPSSLNKIELASLTLGLAMIHRSYAETLAFSQLEGDKFTVL